MTEHPFDEHFRERLRNYSSPVPAGFWERVQPQKDKDRNKPTFWSRYLILSGLLLACLAAGYFISTRPGSGSHPAPGAHPAAKLHPITDTHSVTSSQPGTGPHPIKDAPPVDAAHPASDAHSTMDHQPDSRTSLPQPPLSTPIPASASPTPVSHFTATRNRNRFPALHSDRYDAAHTHSSPNGAVAANLAPDASGTSLSAAASGLLTKRSSARLACNNLPGLQPIPHSKGHPSARLFPAPPPPLPHKKDNLRNNSRWALDGYASPDWPILRGETNGQKTLLSYTIGLRLTRSFGNHFSGTVGVQYGVIKMKTSSPDTLAQLNPHLNSSSLDIPLLIGYNLDRKHLQTTIQTGIICNKYSFGHLYQRPAGLSLYLGLNLVEKINDRLSLFTEPYYRHRLSNMAENTQPFQQNIDIAGLSAGIRYNFKKAQKHK